MHRKLYAFLIITLCFTLLRSQSPMWEVYGQEFFGAVKDGPYLWMIANGGLTKYDTEAQQIEAIYDQSNSPINASMVYWMQKGRDGKIWVATSTTVFSFDGVNWQQFDIVAPNQQPISSVFVDARGEMWAHAHNLIYHYDGQTLDTLTSLNGVDVNFYFITGDVDSSVYFYGYGDCVKYKNGIATNINIPMSSLTGEISHVKNDTIYFTFFDSYASQKTFAMYDGSNWTNYYYNIDSIPGAYNGWYVTGPFIDTSGLMYFSFLNSDADTTVFATFNGTTWTNYIPPIPGTGITWIDNKLYLYNWDLGYYQFGYSNGYLYEPLAGNQWRQLYFHESPISRAFYQTSHGNNTAFRSDGAVFTVLDKSRLLITELNGANYIDSSALSCSQQNVYYQFGGGLTSPISCVDTQNHFWNLVIDTLLKPYLVCPQTCSLFTFPDDTCSSLRMYRSSDGAMWVTYCDNAYANCKLYKFTNNTLTLQSGVGDYQINVTPAYMGGNYYFLGYANNVRYLLKYDGTTADSISFSTLGLPNNYPVQVAANTKLYVLLGASNNSPIYHLMVYNDTAWNSYLLPNDQTEFALGVGSMTATDTCVWIATNKWMYKFVAGNFTKLPLYTNKESYPQAFIPRADGKFWFMEGIKIFNPNGIVNDYQLHSITGYAFIDANHNHVFDTMEAPLPYQRITNGQAFTFTQANGYYELNTSLDTGFVHLEPTGYHTTVYDSLPYNFVTSNNQPVQVNFPCNIIPGIYDVTVGIQNYDCFLLGFNGYLGVVYANIGTEPIATGTIHLTFDTALIFSDIYGLDSTYTNLTDTSVDVAYTNLEPNEQRYLVLNFVTSSFFPLSIPLDASATIYPLIGDTTPLNNFAELTDTTCSSFDPNDKKVSPEGIVDSGQVFTYTIRFQNTGNYIAYRVIISDTLDEDLDVTTLNVLFTSHACEWSLHGRVLSFIFNNIMLPDSATNEPASHGFVKYSIKPKTNTPQGQPVTNTAFIYFDFNSPVATNTVINFVGEPTLIINVQEQKFGTFVYPNPFSTNAIIKLTEDNDIPFDLDVFDISGSLVFHQSGNKHQVTVPGQTLSSGLYLYQLRDITGRVSRGKLIAQ